MLVKEGWQLVQCSHCDKINRIPGSNGGGQVGEMANNNLEVSYPYMVLKFNFSIYLCYVHFVKQKIKS